MGFLRIGARVPCLASSPHVGGLLGVARRQGLPTPSGSRLRYWDVKTKTANDDVDPDPGPGRSDVHGQHALSSSRAQPSQPNLLRARLTITLPFLGAGSSWKSFAEPRSPNLEVRRGQQLSVTLGHDDRSFRLLRRVSGSRSPILGPTVVTSGHGSMASGGGSTPARSAAIRSK
jgi:hypothetical protein